METAKVDIRKLQLLNDRINQCLEALSQVRLTVHGLSHTSGQIPGGQIPGQGLGLGLGQGFPSGVGTAFGPLGAMGPGLPYPPFAGLGHSTPIGPFQAFGQQPFQAFGQQPFPFAQSLGAIQGIPQQWGGQSPWSGLSQ
jgi:hypothetical protein